MKSVNATTGIFTIGIDSNASLNNTFTDVVNIRTPSRLGGNIRIIPALNGNESSIAYYARNDTRYDVVGDGWTCGVNCWDNQGNYIIGAPGLNNCFNINLSGNVNIAYGIITPAITVNDISASTSEYLNIGDNAVITGYLSVLGNTVLSNALTVKGNGYNGTIKCAPLVDTGESSLVFSFINIVI